MFYFSGWYTDKNELHEVIPMVFSWFSMPRIKTYENGNPMFLLAPVNVVPGQTSSENHAFFGVGYQLTSTGDFIRDRKSVV